MDKLLPQAELRLNHLIPYGANPNISAFEGLHECQFDFRAHPIARAGTKVLIHDKPTGRSSWAPHGVLVLSWTCQASLPLLQRVRSRHTNKSSNRYPGLVNR